MSADLEGTPIEGVAAEILEKTFKPETRPNGYSRFRGMCLPVAHSSFAERIENLEVRDDDIWVSSYPKTGTTWTQEMVWCIMNDLDFEKGQILIQERFPFLEHSSLFEFKAVMENNPDLTLPLHVADSVSFVKDFTPPRFIKSHSQWQLLPKQIRTGEKTPKIIYVTRNPKDTLISYYHHCVLLEGYNGTLSDFLTLFIEDALPFSPFWQHVYEFWVRRHQPNVLFLTYEQLKKDLPSCIKRTAVFLEKSLTEEQEKILAEHLSFKTMKSNKSVNLEVVLDGLREKDLIPKEGEFIRSGKGGEWKDKLTQEELDKLDAWVEKNLKKYGLVEVWKD